jgi:hypothetical protein
MDDMSDVVVYNEDSRVEKLAPFVGRKTAAEIAEHFTRQRVAAGLGTDVQDLETSRVQ